MSTITTYPYESVSAVHPGSIPIALNASLLKSLYCLRNTALKSIYGYRQIESNIIAQTGTALHKFCAVYDITNGSMGDAIMAAMAIAPKDPKIQGTLSALFRSKPDFHTPVCDKEGRLFVEKELWIPWRRYSLCDGKDYTICLYATPDRVCVTNDVLRLQDYKTSLYYKAEDALRKYDYEIQFKFYCWLLYQFGHMFLPLEIANLARDFRLTSQVIVAQVGSNPKWTVGSIKSFTPADVEYIESSLDFVINTILLPLHTGVIEPYPNGQLTNSCANCDFKHYCHTPDKSIADGILAAQFARRAYGPAWLDTTTDKPF